MASLRDPREESRGVQGAVVPEMLPILIRPMVYDMLPFSQQFMGGVTNISTPWQSR